MIPTLDATADLRTVEGGFRPERARSVIESICYPRRVGSEGERQAADLIETHFRGLGLAVEREAFPVFALSAEVTSRVIFVSCAAMVVLGFFLASPAAWAAALCWGGAALLINSPWWGVQRGPSHTWPWHLYSQNLIARVESPAARSRVIFMAHYDTKSQLVPTGVRVLFVTGTALLCALLTFAAVLASGGWEGVWTFARPAEVTILVVFFLIGLVVNGNGNRSPGALDNGSGVGALVEIARTFRPPPEAPIDVLFVASGSEETDLEGARHFLKQHDVLWEEKPTLLINLESIGYGRLVYLAGEEKALRLAEATAGKLGVRHARLHVMGAGMDHQPFAAAGLPAVSVLGDVVRASFSMHTPRDNMRWIQNDALARAGAVAMDLALAWGEQHAGKPAAPEAVSV